MRQSEAVIVKAILAYLNALPRTKAVKTHGSNFGEVGTPDLDGCTNGKCLKLEVKVPGEDATPIQQHRLAQWAAVGAVTGVVHSVEETQHLLFPSKEGVVR